MIQTVILGIVIGATFMLCLRLRAARAEERAARSRQRLAALVVCEEMKAAISALDLALRADNSKWLVSMSESRTLSEAWHEHGEELAGLGARRWEVLSEAVTAVAPSYGLVSVSAHGEDLRRSLTERRELLAEGVGILSDAHRATSRQRRFRSHTDTGIVPGSARLK
jgi:hypothetical protein